MDRIQAGQPLAVGIDIIFAERDRYSPDVLAKRYPQLPAEAVAGLPDPDQQLAAALAGPPTVLAVVGLTRLLPGATQPARPLPVFSQDIARDRQLPRFVGALTSRPMLESASAGEGLINASSGPLQSNSERGVLRRVPTIALVNDLPFLSLPLEMLRLALGEGGQAVAEGGPDGMTAIRIGDYRLPTQANGELLLHFGKASSNYYLSAADVLAGVHPQELFKSRFVIIGFNSTGLQDRIFAEAARVLRPGGVFIATDGVYSPETASFHDGDTYVPVDPATLPDGARTRVGDLASDELREIVGESAMDSEMANTIIMRAREHWFPADEAGQADAVKA